MRTLRSSALALAALGARAQQCADTCDADAALCVGDHVVDDVLVRQMHSFSSLFAATV